MTALKTNCSLLCVGIGLAKLTDSGFPQTWEVGELICSGKIKIFVFAVCRETLEVRFMDTWRAKNRLTTCLENLEMSGNLTAVREMSDILLKIREMSGKKYVVREKWLKIVYCIHFWLCWNCAIWFWFRIMICCIPTPPLTVTLVQAWCE